MENLLELLKNTELIRIPKEVYEKVAHRKTTEGVLAVAKTKNLVISNLELNKNPLILIAEAPEKPGNIGALLRTADAAGLDAVLIANPKTDLYNPNIIRSSVGCIFTANLATGDNEEIISYLKKHHIQILTAALREDSAAYDRVDFKKPTAIVVGAEDTGLSDIWLNNADQHIIIPMKGKIDSLNVSVSAAILIFEATRQRNNL
ncbi:MAG: RNA methyltransferase [Flavobacteriaceae bacterium]|nr:RNA methyltransferase [Flavobacteriaceae bacterium]